jgi:hypothetical protein
MKRSLLAGMAAALIAAPFSAPAFAQTTPKPKPVSAPVTAPRASAAISLPAPDKGSFRILLGGTEVGAEQFETRAAGNDRIVRSETVIRIPGQPETRSTGELHLTADGTPLGYKWSAQAERKASGVVEFAADGTAKTGIIVGGPVTITQAVVAGPAAQAVAANPAANFAVGNNVQVDVGASQEMVTVTAVTPTSFSAIFSKNHSANAQVIRPYEQDFIFQSPRVAILDNNLYSQYALLAQLYDWSTKGQQTITILIPQDMTPGAVSVESLGPKTVEGGTFDVLRVNTDDLEVLAYYDARRRLMRVEVPAATVTIVRR